MAEYGGDELDETSGEGAAGRLDGIKSLVDEIDAEAEKMDEVKAGG